MAIEVNNLQLADGVTLDIAPLLAYLRRLGFGRWETFKKALRGLDRYQSDDYAFAMQLSVHGLVEFHWDGDLSWSWLNPTLVLNDLQEVARWSVFGGAISRVEELCDRARCELQVGKQEFTVAGRGYKYQRVIALSHPSLVRESVGELFPDLAFLKVTKLGDILPCLSRLLDALPPCEPRGAAQLWNAATRKAFRNRNFDSAAGLWRTRYRPRRYYFVAGGVAKAVNPQVGFWLAYAAHAEGGYAGNYDENKRNLTLPRFPRLPPLFGRTLFFSGARLEYSLTDKVQWYRNVAPITALQIAAKLGIELGSK